MDPYDFRCPACNAPPDHYCMTRSGRQASKPHALRNNDRSNPAGPLAGANSDLMSRLAALGPVSESDTKHPAYRATMMLKYRHSGAGTEGWDEKFAHLVERGEKEAERGKPSRLKSPVPQPWRPRGAKTSASVVQAGVLDANEGKSGRYGVHGALRIISPLSSWSWYRTTIDPMDERLVLANGGGHGHPKSSSYGVVREYADRIKAGEVPPPLLIVSTFQTWLPKWDPTLAHPGLLVMDGNHRVAAAEMAGLRRVAAWIGVGGKLNNPGRL